MGNKDKKNDNDVREEFKMREYAEAGMNMRNFVNFRFAHLTIFLALTGLLITRVFEGKPNGPIPLGQWQDLALGFAGIITVVVFYAMEKSGVDHYFHFKVNAKNIEEEIRDDELGQYSQRRQNNKEVIDGDPGKLKFWAKNTTATFALKVLFRSVFVFWVGIIAKELIGLKESLRKLDICDYLLVAVILIWLFWPMIYYLFQSKREK